MTARGSASRRKRVLVAVPRPPFALHSGERWIQALITRLAARYDVSLFTFLPPEDSAAAAYCLRLEAMGLRRVYALPSPAPEETSPEFPDIARAFSSDRAMAELARIVREDPPDLVHIHFFEMAHYVAALPREIPAVLTEHDASHFWTTGSYLREAAADGEILRRRRHARDFYPRFSAVTAVSAADAAVLDELAGAAMTELVRLSVDVEGLHPPLSVDEEPARPCDLLFVGNYRHFPNEEAVVRFHRDILPLLRARRPSVTLRLAGAHPTPAVRHLQGAGVEVTGALASLRPVLKAARVFVAPVRLGSGVKGKVLEAFAAGLPVVATPEVAAGFDAGELRAMRVGRDSAGFARAIEELLSDEAGRDALARRAADLARERYDDARAAEDFAGIFERLWASRLPRVAA